MTGIEQAHWKIVNVIWMTIKTHCFLTVLRPILIGALLVFPGFVPLSVLADQWSHVTLGHDVQRSPDGSLVATIVSLQQRHLYGETPSLVKIRGTGGHLLAFDDFSNVNDEGYTVEKAVWTSDSRYFVFSIANSGGHSPWHHPVFFYNRNRNRFYSLDVLLSSLGHGQGDITGDFRLRSLCTIVTRARYYGKSQPGLTVSPIKDGSGEHSLTIDLGRIIEGRKRPLKCRTSSVKI